MDLQMFFSWIGLTSLSIFGEERAKMNEKEKKKEEHFSFDGIPTSLHLELHQLCSVVFADDMMNLCNFAELWLSIPGIE